MKRILLLVALGAAGVVVYLLLPYVDSRPLGASHAYTQHTIQSLEIGLEAFKQEFGIYPPSNAAHDKGAMPYGRSALVYYLMGPNQKGWGASAGNISPFGTSATKAYPPFFVPDHPGDLNTMSVAGGPELPVLMDAFTPPRPFLYFRAEAGRTPLFDVRDNPLDPTGRTGFVNQAHLEMLVRPKGSYWVREDYLLISAGPDGIYGPVVEDPATGKVRPAQPGDTNAECDDVTNFKH